MPNQTFSHRATANAPPADVWVAMDAPMTWESIGGIDRVHTPKIDNGRLVGFSFDTVVGGKAYRGEATSSRRIEGELIAWNVANSEVSGVTTVALSPLDHKTLIEVTLYVESKGFLSSMFFSALARTIGSGLPSAVDEFAARLSTGD